MPSPQPLRELISLLNRLNTPILDIDDTSYSPASPTIELSTLIRHQLLYKPTARRHMLSYYFTNIALL